MSYFRAWVVVTFAWAATSLLLAPLIADAFFASTAFFWLLLVVAALLPLAHEFIHPRRPYRRAILIAAIALAALLAYSLAEGRRTGDLFWIPLAWVSVLGFSDWLFVRAQPTVVAPPPPNQDVKARLRGYAARNIDRAKDGFDANAAEFAMVFRDEQPQGGVDVQLGSLSMFAVMDFMSKKFGLEAALSAFFIVFQRVYDDPRQSEVYLQLRRHVSTKLSEISFPDQEDKMPYLAEVNIQRVWELVNDPKHLGKKDDVRLAIAMVGLFVGTKMKPPLTEDKDRETLMRLVKRTLNRMRVCLQK